MKNTLTLQREIINAEPGSNGDRFWERLFNDEQSVERCQSWQCKSRETKLWFGLELLRAKLNLEHGKFYEQLYRIPIHPVTAWRRMDFARDFMEYSRVILPEEKPSEDNIAHAMELLFGKSFILKDFFDELDKKVKNPDDFLPAQSASSPSVTEKNIFGFGMSRICHKIDRVVREQYTGWTLEQRQEAKDTLEVIANQFLGRRKHLDDLDFGESWILRG